MAKCSPYFFFTRIPKRHTIVGEKKVELKKKTHELEPFLVGLSPSTIKFKLGKKLSRLLQVYREKKAKKEQRQEEVSKIIFPTTM